jgi:DNA polymerase-3 subunit alpha
MNLEVIPPDVNTSEADFSVRDGKIAFALAAIKGCGGSAGESIAAARRLDGPFRSLFDFCERCDPSVVSRGAIESLIKAGAFDRLHPNRNSVLQSLDRALQAGVSKLADRKAGQKGLFDDDAAEESPAAVEQSLVQTADWPEKERSVNEKEVLGYYLTSHPLDEHRETLATYCSHSTAGIANVPGRSEVYLGGMISSLKYSHTKANNAKYVMFDLEDLDGIIRCILWPDEFAKIGQLVVADAILAVRGTVDRRPGSEEANLIVNELFPLDELKRRGTKGVVIRIDEEKHGPAVMDRLKEVVAGFPGTCNLQLALSLADGSRLYLKSNSLHIELNPAFRERIDELLGPGNLRAITAPPPSSPPPPRNNGYQKRPVGAS